MGRICAWCGAVIRLTSGGARPVSHGLCPGCYEDLRAALLSSGLHQTDPVAFRSAP
jgi:hypothetical protein